MVWQVMKLERNMRGHRGDWNRLNAHLAASNPYLDSEFIEPLLQHFGSGEERLCVLKKDSQTIGMLIVEPCGLAKWCTFLPAQLQLGPVLLSELDDISELFSSLSAKTIALDLLAQDPNSFPIPDGSTERPLIGKRHAHTMSIELTGTFEEYWRIRPTKLRQNVNRIQRRATETFGRLTYVSIHDANDIPTALKRYGELETRGWKGAAGTAINESNDQGRFYLDVLSRFAEKGHAHVYELYFDDNLVASRLAVSSQSMLVMLKTTYDETQSKFAPGRILLAKILDDLFDRKPFDCVEFYTDANNDLMKWSTSDRWVEHYLVFRTMWLKRLYQRIRKP